MRSRPSLAGADLVLLVEHTMDVYKQRPPLVLLRIAFGDLLAWRVQPSASVCLSLWHLGLLN